MASNDENAMFMQSKEDLSLPQSWRLTYVPFKTKGELSQQKDVKNEGTSGDVYENKGKHDTMPDNKSRFWPENA